MKQKKIQGIYCITNKINGNQYIGRSIDIQTRWKQHINETKTKKMFNIHKAIKKYGIESFTFEVLEVVKNKEDLTKREVYWYEKIKPKYNMVKPDKPKNILDSIIVQSIDVITKQVKTYESIREAARQNNISKTAISNVLKGIRNTANGCYWKYENDTFVEPIDRGNNGLRRVQITIEKDGVTKTFETITECAKYLDVTISLISRSAVKKHKVKGYKIYRGGLQ